MGLDTVELVIAFEEEFGVAIDNDDAEKMKNPGDVADYMISRVRSNSDDPCLSQIGFYHIRSILMDEFNIPRKLIHPNTLLKDVIGDDIRNNWTRLKKALGADYFPKLKRIPAFTFTITTGIPGLVSLCLIWSGQSGSIAFISFLTLAVIANQLTSNRGNVIPSNVSTVATLIPFVGCVSTKVWSREQALKQVIEITAEQLGIKKENIRENSHFVHDLGAD